MIRARATIGFFLLVTTASFVPAQNAPVRNQASDQTAIRSQPLNPSLQKISSIIEGVLEAQKSFADENLRVVTQAHIADMLWKHDESRARRLFEEVLPAAERVADQAASPPHAVGLVYPARTEVIRLIMQHDAEWATRLIESRGEITVDPKTRSLARNRERATLQAQLATFLAQRDPQRAVLALKPFVENSDFNFLMTLLSLLRIKDANAADNLFIEAVTKARLGQPDFEAIRRFAAYVFPNFGEGVLRFAHEADNRDHVAPKSGPAAAEQFLDLAYEVTTRRLDAALTGANGVRLNARSALDYALPKLLVPYFDRFLPDRAAAFRRRVVEALRRVPAEDRQYLVLTESGTIEELLIRADGITDVRLKDTLINRAILQAFIADDFERSAKLIDRLSTEAVRTGARKTLSQRISDKRLNDAWSALNKGDLEMADSLSPEISDWRTDGLFVRSLVGQLARKDKPRATRILEGYEQKAAAITEPTDRALRAMQLASVAANIDLNRGFDRMKRAIEEFNAAGFVPELDRYRDNAASENGSTAANIGLRGLLNNWDLRWMGSDDFDRAIAVSRGFQMREASALMQLNICRGGLMRVPAAR